MAIDVSQVLGSPQIAAARVTPRGSAWRQVSRQSFSPLAFVVAPLVAKFVLGPKPPLGGAQTPRFGVAILAVTSTELVLVGRTTSRAAPAALARVPLAEVETFDLKHARIVWPLTITFHNGDSWLLEVPRFAKKAATAVAAAVNGQPQQGLRSSQPTSST
jgi:hypothetical protein